MEDYNGSLYDWESIAASGTTNAGNRHRLVSFLCADNGLNCFSKFTLPIRFVNDYGNALPSSLYVKVDSYVWKCQYIMENSEIGGLNSFMKLYNIKLYNIVQFNYYGDGLFKAKVYNENAMERKRMTMTVDELENTEGKGNLKEEELEKIKNSLEAEKLCALLTFNAIRNNSDYFVIKIKNDDIKNKFSSLVLEPSFVNLYKTWKKNDTIYLRLIRRTWEVEVETEKGECILRKGWSEFANETELGVDDIVSFYRNGGNKDMVNVCIFKAGNEIHEIDEGIRCRNVSFIKTVSASALCGGLLVVPILLQHQSNDTLNKIKFLNVSGYMWGIGYSPTYGHLFGLKGMMTLFNVQPMETIVFSMDDTDERVMIGRIYGKDGMEVDYTKILNKVEYRQNCSWFVDIEWNTEAEALDNIIQIEDSGSEDDNPGDQDLVAEFTTTLSKCHVDKKCHGVNRSWASGEIVQFKENACMWNIGILLNHGRPRFSAGWSTFVSNRNLKKKDKVVFRLHDGEDGCVFFIQIHRKKN